MRQRDFIAGLGGAAAGFPIALLSSSGPSAGATRRHASPEPGVRFEAPDRLWKPIVVSRQ
jgi:hypothetical protein